MKKWIPLLALLFIISLQSKADHTFGADITYKTTATAGVFEVTLLFYRDCTGIPICTGTCGAACTRTLSIKGADASCASSTFGSFTLNLVSVRDVKDNHPAVKNICYNNGCATPGTFYPAVERYEFVGYANIGSTSGIPTSCCNVRFVFEECCRSASIINAQSWTNFYNDATVNRCLAISPGNSSPTYINDPISTMCGGETVMASMGATRDPDGDSLSYAFAPALEAIIHP